MNIKKQLKKYQKRRKRIDAMRNYIYVDFSLIIPEINKRIYSTNKLVIETSKELVSKTKYYNELIELLLERIRQKTK